MARYQTRSKRRALLSLALVIALLAAAIATDAWFRREATTFEIREDRILTTPEPTPPPAPLPETWTHYDVPLSDDLQRYTAEVCRAYNVPTALVLAVMDAESDFQEDAVSEDGCDFGLMQIRAAEHTDRCIRLNTYNLLDARQNILTGVDFLAELIGYYDGDYRKTLSFYNHDATGCYAATVLAEAERIAESATLITDEGR